MNRKLDPQEINPPDEADLDRLRDAVLKKMPGFHLAPRDRMGKIPPPLW